MTVTLEIGDAAKLGPVLARVRQVDGVRGARRR